MGHMVSILPFQPTVPFYLTHLCHNFSCPQPRLYLLKATQTTWLSVRETSDWLLYQAPDHYWNSWIHKPQEYKWARNWGASVERDILANSILH